MKQWLIFDAMGVVYEVGDDTRELLIPYIQKRKPIDTQTLEELYESVSLGDISPEDFWRAAMFQNPAEVQEDYLNTCLTLNPSFPAAAQRLSAQYDIAMLSNDIAEWSLHLRRRFGLESLFRSAVISSAVKCKKPDPKIYEILLSILGVEAKHCIFVDDRAKNLAPARALGMRTILFNREGVHSEGYESVASFEELEQLFSFNQI